MHRINIYPFGFAVGLTVVIIYIGCIIAFSFVSTETAVAFLNNLMHSVDLSTIIRKASIPFSKALIGVVEWFVFGWLTGAGIAAIYNACNKFHKL